VIDGAFRALRLAEIADSIALLERYAEPLGDLLEIGAGTGWQARALSRAGYHVEAIDLPAERDISNHARAREWPIRDYDGAHIPFADAAFDIVYSSNVLEHVERLDTLMEETRRVLRPDGIALHLLPNPQWRALSLLSYYPGQAKDLLRWLGRKGATSKRQGNAGGMPTPGPWAKARARLLPPTHGAVGTPLSEIGRFSKASWDRYFTRMGWEIVHYGNNGLAATGDYLLGGLFGTEARKRLGRLIGGIAHVYVLRPGHAR
jgi:SAM-dependent methyltransferase